MRQIKAIPTPKMRVHFIAIGGSIMHSLAIALRRAGHKVTGSDDQIYDPARSKLEAHGLLPEKEGWSKDKIDKKLDAVILGMHAFEDNPELERARELDVPVYSFPEYIFQFSKNKQRIVIAGSYGKTTVTAMVMFVLEGEGRAFDYLVGAEVPGFDNAVSLSETAPVIVLEGDEYLASKLDPRPKFLLYKPHICVINGISWDHINVFPSIENYNHQFELLLQSLSKAADVVYAEADPVLNAQVEKLIDEESQYKHPFKTPDYQIIDGKYEVKIGDAKAQLKIIGKHNMDNLNAAWKVCELLGVEPEPFLKHMANFEGASSRMELVYKHAGKQLYKDYAHAPAKVKATVEAARERFKQENIIACLELHTFSSLNKEFLPHYKGSLASADTRIVYINPHVFEKRRIPVISEKELRDAFDDATVIYLNSPDDVKSAILDAEIGNDIVLMMSSGNFGGKALKEF